MPRFSGPNAQSNASLVAALARMATARGVSPAQLAIAWVRAKAASQGVTIVPVMGARTRKQLSEALSSLDISLDASEVADLEAAVPASQVAGSRYAEVHMAMLDSEK